MALFEQNHLSSCLFYWHYCKECLLSLKSVLVWMINDMVILFIHSYSNLKKYSLSAIKEHLALKRFHWKYLAETGYQILAQIQPNTYFNLSSSKVPLLSFVPWGINSVCENIFVRQPKRRNIILFSFGGSSLSWPYSFQAINILSYSLSYFLSMFVSWSESRVHDIFHSSETDHLPY